MSIEEPTGVDLVVHEELPEKKTMWLKIRTSRPARALAIVWNNRHIWRVATLALVAIVAYLFSATSGPISDFHDSDPYYNGFVPPRDFGGILKKLDASVVTIFCDVSKDKGNLGTAWSMEYSDITNGGRSALMTNHHVVEDCIGQGELSIKDVWGKTFDARLESYDVENDLAIVSTSHKIPPLQMADYPPAVGYWVLAYGTADGYAGSVAIGNVLNITTDNDILVTAALSHGNSGGPLVDNEGKVFGVSTATMIGEQYNVVGSLDRFCASLISCNGDTFWNWD